MGRKPSKSTGKGKQTQDNNPVERDDGTRWVVRDRLTGNAVYATTTGIRKSEAERLAVGLVSPAYIEQITK